MAILSTVVKDFFRQKTDSGYITLKPKTDADCVSYINSDAVETDVQTELDEINNNLSELYFSYEQYNAYWDIYKFSNGLAIATFKISTGTTIALTTKKFDGIYTSDGYASVTNDLPTGLFVSTRNSFINVESSGYTNCQVLALSNSQISYRVWSPYSATYKFTIHIMVVGRWK